MFCPKCGFFLWDMLFGGSCKFKCKSCGFCMCCINPFTGKFEEDTMPTSNILTAIYKRFKYENS